MGAVEGNQGSVNRPNTRSFSASTKKRKISEVEGPERGEGGAAKRKKKMPEENSKMLARLAASLEALEKKQLTKADVEEAVENKTLSREEVREVVQEEMKGYTKHHDKVIEKLECKMTALKKEVDEKLGQKSAESERPQPKTKPGTARQDMSLCYMEARCSFKLSPLSEGTEESVRNFLEKQMGMPRDAVESITFKAIRKLFARNKVKEGGQNLDTVQVTCAEVEDRDLITSYVSNLDGKVNLDPVIPQHLHTLKKQLECKAFQIRTEGKRIAKGDKNLHVSTNVRLDDVEESLSLAIRLKKGDQWTLYKKKNIPTFNELWPQRGEDGEDDGEEEDHEDMETVSD